MTGIITKNQKNRRHLDVFISYDIINVHDIPGKGRKTNYFMVIYDIPGKGCNNTKRKSGFYPPFLFVLLYIKQGTLLRTDTCIKNKKNNACKFIPDRRCFSFHYSNTILIYTSVITLPTYLIGFHEAPPYAYRLASQVMVTSRMVSSELSPRPSPFP